MHGHVSNVAGGRIPSVLGLVEAKVPVPATAVAACTLVQYRQNVAGVQVLALVAPFLKATIMYDSGCDPRAFLWLRLLPPGSPPVALCVC